jgi:CheY-like chemotaxis protein
LHTQRIVTNATLQSQRGRGDYLILLAEDNAVNQKIACRIMQKLGFRAIRALERGGRRIPIIALTAHAIKGSDEVCKSTGMDEQLTKPIDRERLLACLDRFLCADSIAGSTLEVIAADLFSAGT